MFIIQGQHANADIREPGEIDGLVRHLGEQGYRPVLRSMLRTACDVAALDPDSLRVDALVRSHAAFRRPDLPPLPPGDLFFKGDLAYLLQPVEKRLLAWEVRLHTTGSDLMSFCGAVETAARKTLDGRRLRGMDFTWKELKERPTRRFAVRRRLYQAVKLDTKAPDYTSDESRAARLLVQAPARTLLLRLAQVGKARSVDTGSETDPALTGPLLEAGLLRKEYLVLCRQDSHTICAVQDRGELEAGRGAAFVCTICGRCFKDELIQEIFALSDNGKRLITGSRWMTIWVTELLLSAGIQREHIAWNAVAGEDELDIMTDALGPRVFLELKDREFGLGDAYPFAYRVARYGGTFGFVLSTDRVADEAKKFFQEQRPTMEARIEVLESPEGIQTGLELLVDRVSRSGVNQLIMDLSESIGLDLAPVLQAWMERTASRSAASNMAIHPTVSGVTPVPTAQAARRPGVKRGRP